MTKSLLLAVFVCCILSATSLNVRDGFLDRPLLPDKEYRCCSYEPYKSRRDLPVIYCYDGSPKILLNIWQTVSALINLNPEQYDSYEGSDVATVWEQFEAHRSSWSPLSLINWRSKHIRLNPFNKTCLGIRSHHDYVIKLQVTQTDYLQVAIFSAGFILFFLSPILADNPLFYYLTGISFGMMASVLIMFYFILKLLPMKKPLMLTTFAGGSTLALLYFQTVYENAYLLASQYQAYVLGYLLSSGLISFIVCYRFGPVSNPRSKNLIQWTLQVVALAMIFFSSYFQELMMAVIIIILFFYNVPLFRWIFGFGKLCKTLLFTNRPRPKLLTEEEYNKQGIEETKKGLHDLRTFCSSPECQQWQTILRLKDPHRFARFIQGKAHVTKEEIENYEQESKEIFDALLTDDSDSNED